MSKIKLITVITFVLVSVLLTAATPMAQSELVSLTIENQTKDFVTFQLQGKQNYYLYVRPDTTTTFTIRRGEYDQKFYSCGVFVNTTFDLTKMQSIVVPPCGEKAFKAEKHSHLQVDAGKLIKLVKVTFENDTKSNLMLILNGPAEYVFSIKAGDEVSYTIARGDYDVRQWGCTYYKTFNFYAHANKVRELTCPKW